MEKKMEATISLALGFRVVKDFVRTGLEAV